MFTQGNFAKFWPIKSAESCSSKNKFSDLANYQEKDPYMIQNWLWLSLKEVTSGLNFSWSRQE